MVFVLGSNNCGRCLIIKNILEEKKIEFTYDLIENLTSEEVEKYMTIATEKGQRSMPLIFKDSKLITLQEV